MKTKTRSAVTSSSLPALALARHPRSFSWLLLLLSALLGIAALALPARAQMDQAKPGQAASDPHAALAGGDPETRAAAATFAKQVRTTFEKGIQLDEFRILAIQHLDQVKIIDSWARQNVRTISHSTPKGMDVVYFALDMAIRPEAWLGENIIYVESVPIREELGRFAGSTVEATRIRDTGKISLNFLRQEAVLARLEEIGLDSRQLEAVNKVKNAAGTFLAMDRSLKILPPTAAASHDPWLEPVEVVAARIAASAPAGAPAAKPQTAKILYTADQQLRIQLAFEKLGAGWRGNDVNMANQGLAEFIAVAPSINPSDYPSHLRRTVELWYNRTFSGMLVAFIYFAALVLFFMTAMGITKRTRKTALRVYSVALACHVAAMGIRWWISGRIPIQNQFESIMGSAALGCVVGLILELRKKNGVFGAAFAFVGWIATTILLAAPYVFGNDLGAAPGVVAGILENTWLYIHVNIVIASYSLIMASAGVALFYLGLRQWHWINPIEPGFEEPNESGSGGGRRGGNGNPTQATAVQAVAQVTAERTTILDTLDQANMVILQMAFWTLGVGIICGAVWADHSWGRPWGWDPKETFALVTWIVYLVVVHVRMVIKQKAHATAWLSLLGCGVMLFNYIGVNYFLKGLHSYA